MNYHKGFKCCVLVTALFFGIIASVSAATVRWAFEDVLFDDGSPITGSFLYDEHSTDANITWFDVRTYDSSSWSNGERFYTENANAVVRWGATEGVPSYQEILFTSQAGDYRHSLVLMWLVEDDDDLLSGNRRIAIMYGQEWLSRISEQLFIGGRLIAEDGAPSLVTPIPTSLLLMWSGLIGLGWFKFRRRKM